MNKKPFWNYLANNYDKNAKRTMDFYHTIAMKISESLDKNSRVLEIATGTGILAEKIAPYCKTIEAIDFSEKMIEQALRKNMPDHIHFSVQDANDLQFPSHSFDAVIILDALHVIPNTANVLENIKKVLKPEGVLIAPTIVKDTSGDHIVMRAVMKLLHFTLWDYDEYLNLFTDHGWEMIRSTHLTENTSTAYVVAKPRIIHP